MNHWPKQAVLLGVKPKKKTSKSKHVDIVLNVIVVPSQQVEPQLNRPINNMTPARSANAQKIPPVEGAISMPKNCTFNKKRIIHFGLFFTY